MKKVFFMFLTAVTVTCSSLTAFAAPETMPDGTVFDAEYYAQTYPDVAAAIGTGRDALYNHYVTLGKAEGRSACASDAGQPAAGVTENPVPSQNKKMGTTPTEALALLEDNYDESLFLLTDSRPTSVLRVDVTRDYSHSYSYDIYGNYIGRDGDIAYTYEYDTEGRLIAKCDYGDYGDYSNYIYDEYGRLERIINYFYNSDYRTEYCFWYDEQGFLTKVDYVTPPGYEAISGVYTYSYDEQGRVIHVSHVTALGIDTWEDRDNIQFTYDEQGKLIRVRAPGEYYIYEYDSLGRINQEFVYALPYRENEESSLWYVKTYQYD